MDHPRKVAESAHKFSQGLRTGVPGLASLGFQFYDFKDFFTNVPNRLLRRDIQNTIMEVRRLHPDWNFF